jgi:hypothetical protein
MEVSAKSFLLHARKSAWLGMGGRPGSEAEPIQFTRRYYLMPVKRKRAHARSLQETGLFNAAPRATEKRDLNALRENFMREQNGIEQWKSIGLLEKLLLLDRGGRSGLEREK